MLTRFLYGWAMLMSLAMISFLPLASLSAAERSSFIVLALTAVGSTTMLVTPRRWSLRRRFSLMLGVYGFLGVIRVVATLSSGAADPLTSMLPASVWIALLVAAVQVRRETAADLQLG